MSALFLVVVFFVACYLFMVTNLVRVLLKGAHVDWTTRDCTWIPVDYLMVFRCECP